MALTQRHAGSNIVASTNTPSFTHPERMLVIDNTYFTFVGDKGKIIVNGYQISTIPSNTPITGYKVTLGCSHIAKNSERPEIQLATDLTQGSISYTGIGNLHIIDRNTEYNVPDDYRLYEYSFEVKNSSDQEIIWINNNLQTVLNGTNFGLYLYVPDDLVAINYLIFQLSYGDSNIYVGNNNATAVYLGNNPISAMYVGTTRVF